MTRAEALKEAVERAREDPDLDVQVLVQQLLDEEPVPAENNRRQAIELIQAAEGFAKRLGEDKDAMLTVAICGVGYALLANGEDAEFFYAMFSGPDGVARCRRE
jgi:hypothetical protein